MIKVIAGPDNDCDENANVQDKIISFMIEFTLSTYYTAEEFCAETMRVLEENLLEQQMPSNEEDYGAIEQ